jgi:hypothetical protein
MPFGKPTGPQRPQMGMKPPARPAPKKAAPKAAPKAAGAPSDALKAYAAQKSGRMGMGSQSATKAPMGPKRPMGGPDKAKAMESMKAMRDKAMAAKTKQAGATKGPMGARLGAAAGMPARPGPTKRPMPAAPKPAVSATKAPAPAAPAPAMKRGGVAKYAKGGVIGKMGSVRTAAPSRDGIASKGKTKGTMIKMAGNAKDLKKGGAC